VAVAVVEDDLRAALGEAGELGVDGALEAVLVGLESEGAGEQVGVPLELGGVGGRNAADGGDVLFDAGLFKAGLDEVLRGADEGAGAALDGGAEGGEVAAGFGGEKSRACWASAGTVMKVPSSRTLRSQVSMRVNQASGGGLVTPRRKTQMSR
jgi:hypothetical protein